jgi:hypothetical protein
VRKPEYSVIVDRIIYGGEPILIALDSAKEALHLCLAVLDQAGLDRSEREALVGVLLAALETEIDHNEGASGYWADDGNCAVHYPEASSGQAAAGRYVQEGDWGSKGETWWAEIYTWQGTEERETHVITVHPDEPECAPDEEHDWGEQSVQGSGGGVRISRVCSRCDLEHVEDTWAQCRATGRQGLYGITYRGGAE